MIIQHYIFKELFQKLIWIIGLLILVLASNRFVGFLADAVEGNLPGDMVFLMLAYKMIGSLPKLLPVSILVAMLLVFSRLANDRELVILSAAGISRAFQIRIVLKFAAAYCLIVTLTTLFLAPWAERHMDQLKQRAKQESDISGIKAGQFKEFSEGDRVVYVQRPSADGKAMEDVFLQVRQQGKLGVLTSDSTRFTINKKSGNKYILFSDGRRYVGTPGLLDYQITDYEKYALLTESTSIETVGGKLASYPTRSLMKSNINSHQAEFQWRISLILSCLFLSVLAVLLMQSQNSERHYMPFIIGISIYLIYSNVLGIAQTLVKRDVIPTFIGLWWVHILMALTLLGLYYLPILRFRKNIDDDHGQFISAD